MRALCLMSVLAVVNVGCGNLSDAEGQSCDNGRDCVFPAVCCTQPRIPAIDDPVPLCEDFAYCDGFHAVLVEGNPCRRAVVMSMEPGYVDMFQECAPPAVCCGQNLVCMLEAECAATPAPPAAPPTAAPSEPASAPALEPESCTSDSECAPSERCFNLTLRSRDGQCQVYAGGPTVSAPPAPPTNPPIQPYF